MGEGGKGGEDCDGLIFGDAFLPPSYPSPAAQGKGPNAGIVTTTFPPLRMKCAGEG